MEKRILLGILVFAFLLRFIALTSFPVGFNADEASFGYDAYSILRTGRDQWGNFLPIVLKSFGDYKSPLYSYLAIPTVAIFGLNIFAVRLPNVLIGTLAVLFVYLLSNEVYKKKFVITHPTSLRNLSLNNKLRFGILPAFLLAVNPWSIMMSRGVFEANLVTLLIPAGVYFFLRGLKQSHNFIFSAIFFGLSLFSYHSAKLITPLLLGDLTLVFYKELFAVGLRKLLIPLAIFTIFLVSTIYTFTIGGGSRVAERSITQGALVAGAEEKIKAIQMGTNPALAKLLHNKYQIVAGRFRYNYFQYFSSKFLFTRGAGESYYGMIPGIGVIYAFEGLMLIGLIFIIKKSLPASLMIIFLWLLTAPLPAALSTGVGYSGNRAIGMVPALQILESLGFVGWLSVFGNVNKKIGKSLLLLLSLLGALSISKFIISYTQKIPQSSYQQMLYGNLEAVKFIEGSYPDKNIVVSRSLSEPQIFIAFENKWDPAAYQTASQKWNIEKESVAWVDQLTEYTLGRYTIKSIDWDKDPMSNIVVLAKPDSFPKGLKLDKIVYYPDGTPSIYVKSY